MGDFRKTAEKQAANKFSMNALSAKASKIDEQKFHRFSFLTIVTFKCISINVVFSRKWNQRGKIYSSTQEDIKYLIVFKSLLLGRHAREICSSRFMVSHSERVEKIACKIWME